MRDTILKQAYADEPGFCKSEGLETIRKFDHVLTPGRYVGTADAEDDGVPFEEKFSSLVSKWETQSSESRKLDDRIGASLRTVAKDA